MASTNPRRRRSAGIDNPSPASDESPDSAAARPMSPSGPDGDPPRPPSSIINAGDCCMVRVRVKVVEYGPDGTELLRRSDPLVHVEIDVAVHHRTLPR